MEHTYKILVKYPSIGRPERFFKGLDTIHNNFVDKDNFHVSCTLDSSDHSMNTKDVIDKISSYKNTSIAWGESNSKIHAVNRSMPNYDFDIILVMSDDMAITFYGIDHVIRGAFQENGLNTLLHIPDNDAKNILATMYIAGKDFYNERGYIYNPIYNSLFCDNAIQEIAKKTGRYRYLDYTGLIFHANPAYGHLPKDEKFESDQKIGWSIDHQTYLKDEANNFGLK